MKQLYATGALDAMLASTVNSMTTGTLHDDVHAVLSATSYLAPPATLGQDDSRLPIRLALLKTQRGRVLTHVTPQREERRWVAHALLDIPPTADAQLAIQTWGSPLWQKQIPEAAHDLPELPYLPVADVLDDAALRDWLKNPAQQELLEYTLSALLTTASHETIYLAAPAEDVARVVFAVTRLLPSSFLEDLTFSTYEPNPLGCNARIVGCDTGSPEVNLPAELYQSGRYAFHRGTGQRSSLKHEVPYAAFAVKAAALGEYAAVEEVKATWQRLGLKDPQQFDLVYRLCRGTGVMSQEEAAAMLQHPPLAAYVAHRSDALNQFLEWALENRDFALNSFTRAAQVLRQKPETAAKLAQSVREAGLQALKNQQLNVASNALEVILPMVAPTKANSIWGEIPALLGQPQQLAWQVRHWLLPRLVRFRTLQNQPAYDESLFAWLDIPTEQLSEFLTLDLPKNFGLLAAARTLDRSEEPTEAFARIVGEHVKLARALLVPPTGASDEKAVSLFLRLLQTVPQVGWLEEVLAHAGDYPATTLNRFFETALQEGRVDADRLLRAQGSRLIELFQGRSGLDKVGTQLMLQPPVDLLRQDSLQQFLDALLKDEAVGEVLKLRIRGMQTIRDFANQPSFEPEQQRAVAAAFAFSPPVVPSGTPTELLEQVVQAIRQQADNPDLQAKIETTLVELGSVLAQNPTDCFENLLRSLRGKVDLGQSPGVVGSFLAIALGAAEHAQLQGHLDGLDGHAFALAQDAAKRGGRPLLAAIETRSTTWPKSARTQWNFLKAAVEPRGMAGLTRDLLCAALGATAVGLVWGLVSLLG